MEARHSSAIAVEKAVQVLNVLGDRGESTLTEVIREVGHGKTAVLRILNALVRQGMVQQDPGTGAYSLTWRVLVLARSLANRADVRSIALPYMLELRDLTEETVTLNARIDFQRVCIEQIEGLHELRWRTDVGSMAPLYGGSTGKMFLATLDPPELERFFATVELEQFTPQTVTDEAVLRSDIEAIRQQGYAHDRASRIPGLAGLSAPIPDVSGTVVAVLTIAGPAARFDRADTDLWRDRLLAATAEISMLLGRPAPDGGGIRTADQPRSA